MRSFTGRYCLIDRRRPIRFVGFLHSCSTCSLKLRSWSTQTPSNLLLVVLSNSSPLLVKILISLTLVPPSLVRSLVPVTYVDFVFSVFNLKQLFLDQFSSSWVLSQSLEHSPEVSVYGEDKPKVVLSAKMSTVVGCDTPLGRSFINTWKSSGEGTESCGTPWVRVWGEDCAPPLMTVLYLWLWKKERIRPKLSAFYQSIAQQCFRSFYQ